MAPIRRSRVEKARQFLTSGAVLREDSDDELGYDDHPWEWIHDDAAADTGADAHDAQPEQNVTPRKRKAAAASLGRHIVGARMGSFACKVGDAVLLKAEGNQAWVGIICDFYEEDGEKVAKFLWFFSEKEIRNQSKKRTDFLPVSQATLPLSRVLMIARMSCTYQVRLMTTPSNRSTALPRYCHSKTSKGYIRQE